MTKDEVLQMCLEYIETNAHERRHVRWAIKVALAEPDERNFCPRCGKRTADLNTIHTCTPPQTIADEHIAKVTSDIDLAVNKALAQPGQEQALLDAIVGGTGVMLGDKRIDPASIYKQPEQEPVARVIDNGTPEGATEWIPFTNRVEPLKTGDLLYGEPPQRQWVGLTDEEIKYCLGPEAVRIPPGWSKLTRAIEAKLKKKNT